MDNKRRDFLKVAGISTLAGLGGTAVIDRLVNASNIAHAAVTGQEVAGGTSSPAAQPATSGIRYGMLVDVRKFREDPSLGKKVVDACHLVHNVPTFPDKKDEIKWIWMTHFDNAFPENSSVYRDEANLTEELPIFCNHCDNPPCVRVCPTKATFRNKEGIVVMDFHRCIGCRFCMAACPYGSRSFNWRNPEEYVKDLNRDYPRRTRGVVEKCNFCAERVAIGLQPACVEATGDSKAMVFGNLLDPHSEIRKMLKENHTLQRNPALGTLPSVFYIV
ncbi:MAG: 4Fe-4S dicluster domain-containing protein [Desulfobulbus sp.]|jgi:molybdopterin-containing oxidoreductase family iron-sulfur binding subunit|nr:4Fe-4S dicluster domain-containing protein [Desulfobulbus sp.]